MNHWKNTQTILCQIRNAFLVCFGGTCFLAVAGIVVLYYSLPATDTAKTSWFPIILLDPFVLTIAFVFATPVAFLAFIVALASILLSHFSKTP